MEEIQFCKQAFEAFRTEIMIVLFGWELAMGKMVGTLCTI